MTLHAVNVLSRRLKAFVILDTGSLRCWYFPAPDRGIALIYARRHAQELGLAGYSVSKSKGKWLGELCDPSTFKVK